MGWLPCTYVVRMACVQTFELKKYKNLYTENLDFADGYRMPPYSELGYYGTGIMKI